MTDIQQDIQKADPAARRQALLLVLVGTVLGVLAIAIYVRFRIPLQAWLLSDPKQLAGRLRLLCFAIAIVLAVPLAAFAGYLWWFGSKAIRTQQFPPPGHRTIRDTPLLKGRPALVRGRRLEILAFAFWGASAGVVYLCWRLAITLAKAGNQP